MLRFMGWAFDPVRMASPPFSGRLRRLVLAFSAIYLLAASAMAIGMGLGLSFYISGRIRHLVTEHVLSLTSEFVTSQVVSRLGLEGPAGLGQHELAKLDTLVREHLLKPPIVRINMWDAEGRLVYSSDPLLRFGVAPGEEVAEALRGKLRVEVHRGSDVEGAGLERYPQVMELYVPIALGEPAQVVGAFELYGDYGQASSLVAWTKRTILVGTGLGLAVLYPVLLLVVWGGQRLIRWQEEELADREQRLHHMAYTDPVTGLPNRSLFKERLEWALAQAQRSRDGVAVIMLDLDRFKLVNDSLGHWAGDELLRAVGARLRASVREEDTVARLGGDEFAIMLAGLGLPEEAGEVASRVLHRLQEPFHLGGHELLVTASLGVALFPQDAGDAEGLLRAADTAMYRAKGQGGDNFQFFTPELQELKARLLST